MRYVGKVRYYLHRCVVSFVMESHEDTRIVYMRVCDTCDNAVLRQNREIAVNMFDSLHCVFWSFEIKRPSLIVANDQRHRCRSI